MIKIVKTSKQNIKEKNIAKPETKNIVEILKEKYDNFVSLGYNCFPKKFIKFKLQDKETDFFDYIGTSMWCINDIIKNNFYLETEEIYKKEDYMNLEIKKNDRTITNKKYYIRIEHDIRKEEDLKKEDKFIDFVEKYKRRSVRFLKMLDEANKNSSKILFIRMAENMEGRIIYEEHKEKMKISEIERIKEFSNIIKSRWKNIKFNILYLANENLEEDNIIIINTNNKITRYKYCELEIENLLEIHKHIIEKVNI